MVLILPWIGAAVNPGLGRSCSPVWVPTLCALRQSVSPAGPCVVLMRGVNHRSAALSNPCLDHLGSWLDRCPIGMLPDPIGTAIYHPRALESSAADRWTRPALTWGGPPW